jgi:hypothetical protein
MIRTILVSDFGAVADRNVAMRAARLTPTKALKAA